MAIRTVQEDDYGKLVSLYANFFKTHDIFQKNETEVISYLQEQAQENELIVFAEDSLLKGALFLVKLSGDENHSRWKFRHFAFETEEIAKQLLDEAEKKVKETSQTAKIELTIAETEEGIDFYKSNGYSQEGALKNHYRWGETCFVLSKSLS